MKKGNLLPITGLATILFISSTSAGELQSLREENCDLIADIARSVMRNRQNGATMRDQMNAISENGEDKVVELIITTAYKRPNYRTKEKQRTTIKEFENLWYRECYEARVMEQK